MTTASERPDEHSHGRPDDVRVKHLSIDWTVDFAAKTLAGHATARIDRHAEDQPLWLDTRALDIDRVELGAPPADDDVAQWTDAKWTLGEADSNLGTPLRIELAPGVDRVRVHYRTSPQASGLQWLAPAQTADGTHGFLYSQAQAIHARSFVPCQDSPGVRVTYEAVVRAPAPMRPLMAAEARGGDSEQGYRFVMSEPVPPYLIALAVGRVEFAAVGDRTGVWAEPSMLARASAEFADMEKMLEATERLYGPYRWGRYDLLVLPPAFPFGGMENPRLTFATPTILAGDRSLVSLVAHEMAHSWSGNLVTNATWSDLWLNEGFTVYIERRIVEALYGRDRAEMEAMLGRQDLLAEFADGAKDPRDQHLKADLSGRDPDDGMTDVPYEKGALFLRTLEETYGREAFDAFLQRWFAENAFTSVTTDQFERFLERELVRGSKPRAGHEAIEFEGWVHAPGLPDQAPKPTSDAFAKVDAELAQFVAGKTSAKALHTADWTPHQWLHFLRAVPVDLPAARLRQLDDTFGFTRSGNYEILAKWLEIAIAHRYAPADVRLDRFLIEVGRRKFLVPLYRALVAAGQHTKATEIYARARPGYHPITQRTLDDILDAS